MATDGPKIVDGDLAHDSYWGIMDLYDSNAEVETIQKEYPFTRNHYGMDDDFYHEIFVTSYALAFWEIGAMNEEILGEVRMVIEKGACVKTWTEIDPKAGRMRKKELEKFLKKISGPNLKIRGRKKYRLISNLYFQPDDLLSFKLGNNFYGAVICTGVFQYRGRCEYVFVPTTYRSLNKPTLADLLVCEILGVRIGSGSDRATTMSRQPGVQVFWDLFPEKMRFAPDPPHFFIGLDQILIPHKDMILLKSHFEKVGNLKIKDNFKQEGSSGWVTDFKTFEFIIGNLENQIKAIGLVKIPVPLLSET